MPKPSNNIGCCFNIDGEEYIYEGSYEEETKGMTCNKCSKPIKSKVHLFNSSQGYNKGSYESRFYGSDCVKSIIQAGYKRK